MAGVGGMFAAAARAPMPISSSEKKPQSLPKRRRVNIKPDSSRKEEGKQDIPKKTKVIKKKPPFKDIKKKKKVIEKRRDIFS